MLQSSISFGICLFDKVSTKLKKPEQTIQLYRVCKKIALIEVDLSLPGRRHIVSYRQWNIYQDRKTHMFH